MKEAIEEARKTMLNDMGGPFGAMIKDYEGKVIAISSNTVLGDNDPTAHAEINAIRKACQKLGKHDLTGCSLYTTGYPCPMCLSAAIWANIKYIYYGTDLKEAELIGFRDDAIYKFIKTGDGQLVRLVQYEHDECLKLLYEYHDAGKQIY